MKRYTLIGLTGQTGAGKSTVSQWFAEWGAMVLNADEMVSLLYVPGSPCLTAVAAVFGADILDSSGGLKREELAKRAFASPDKTALLGSLVHPFVSALMFERLRGAEGVVIFDAPQLFEANADVICDYVISVVADKAIRFQRIIARDNLSAEQAQSRMNAQLDEAFFREHSDFVIENNGDAAAIKPLAADIYKQITSGVT